jgi:putative transposase
MVIRKRLKFNIESFVFITTTVKDWYPVFSDDDLARIALAQLSETTTYYKSDVIAYCLMPTHIHAIVYLPNLCDLSGLVATFKSLSSRKIKNSGSDRLREYFTVDGSYHFWKPRFDDYIFRNFDQLRIKINYIHDNPVRADLVENPIDWKYSSARNWMLDEKGIIDIRKIWFD